MFHGFGPDRAQRVACDRRIPPVVVELGELTGLIYRSAKGDRTERNYIHLLQDPPHLCCDPAGTRLYILGGSYRVTERGIEG